MLPGTIHEVKAFLHVLVDNATSYDVLLGAHFVNRMTACINFIDSYWEIVPDWNTQAKLRARIPLDLYVTLDQLRKRVDAGLLQNYAGDARSYTSIIGEVDVMRSLAA